MSRINPVPSIEEAITAATGRPFKPTSSRRIGGGDINEAICLEGDGQRVFVKRNLADRLPMFAAEVDGLNALGDTGCIRVPRAIAHGVDTDGAWLALEFIEMRGSPSAAGARFGEQLAALHAIPGAHFGWPRDNFIGTTPQPNLLADEWISFLREQRLGFQLRLAANNGAPHTLIHRGEQLLEVLPQFFTTYHPFPSLLHGDLWGGNWGVDETGMPVLFDPAVYRGDREADIAMSELFGGFGADFYAAYRAALPLDPGYGTRRTLYNLYHLLNHFNLFGGGYASQALHGIDSLLAELR
ncbi:fructosamine kinase family protein [Mangrovimicrobium sediminis]|uniref:Fructosamine kinase family protein n=1 Tax=Mangrovimicrobium sediminis TaxID=2562682 RepID=A0A4Z0LXC2_9GAMM|nr:fructosamine kinase family protein [Haliea sp. SAOS-164]TGD71725.1 fructosamine kinase family protein [Haliea sp. SAOS-164]